MVTETQDDIRPALRERLNAVEAELADLPLRQKRLVSLRDSLKALLDRENELRDGVDESLVPAFHPTDDRRTLADLILRVLGTGPKSLEQLKEIGASWAPIRDSAFPGRALNFALVGLQKGGYVVRQVNGEWRSIPEKSGGNNEASKKMRHRVI